MSYPIYIDYAELSPQAMVQIFVAADALRLPPAEVATLYLSAVSEESNQDVQDHEPALSDA